MAARACVPRARIGCESRGYNESHGYYESCWYNGHVGTMSLVMMPRIPVETRRILVKTQRGSPVKTTFHFCACGWVCEREWNKIATCASRRKIATCATCPLSEEPRLKC